MAIQDRNSVRDYLQELLGRKKRTAQASTVNFDRYEQYTSNINDQLRVILGRFQSIAEMHAQSLPASLRPFSPFDIPINSMNSRMRHQMFDELAVELGFGTDLFGPDGIGVPSRWFSNNKDITSQLRNNVTRLFDVQTGFPNVIGLYQLPLDEIFKRHGRIRPIDVLYGTTYMSFDAEIARNEIARAATAPRSVNDVHSAIQKAFRMQRTHIPNYTNLETLADQLTKIVSGQGLLEDGQNILIWDLETGGLSTDSGIWQGTASITDKTGRTVGTDTMSWHFKNAASQTGVLKGTHNLSGPLSKFQYQNIASPDDPADVIKRFLDLGAKTDFRMGGHNLAFDIKHMHMFIQKNIGKINPEELPRYRELFSRFEKAITTPGKIVDTNLLSRFLTGGQSSLENLLRTTNIGQVYMRNHNIGVDDLLERLKNLHYSNVDVSFEQVLFGMMNAAKNNAQSRLATTGIGSASFISKIGDVLDKNQVLALHARVTRQDLIDDRLSRRINDLVGLNPSTGTFVPIFSQNANTAATIGLSPLEQANIIGRTQPAVLGIDSKLDIVSQRAKELGEFFNSYFGIEQSNVRDDVRRFRPDAGDYPGMVRDFLGDYAKTMQGLRKDAPVLTSLGPHEALITRSLAAAAPATFETMGSNMGELMRSAPHIQKMLGVSSFTSQVLDLYNLSDRMGGVSQQGVSMPLSVIEKAFEQAGIAKPNVLTLETPNIGNQNHIAFMYRFGDAKEEVAALTSYLRNVENFDELSSLLGTRGAYRRTPAAERIESIAQALEVASTNVGNIQLRQHGIQVHFSSNASLRKTLNYIMNRYPDAGKNRHVQALLTIGRQTAAAIGADDDSQIIISSAQIAVGESEQALIERGQLEDTQTAKFIEDLNTKATSTSTRDFEKVKRVARAQAKDVFGEPGSKPTGKMKTVLQRLAGDAWDDNYYGEEIADAIISKRISKPLNFIKAGIAQHPKLAGATALVGMSSYYLFNRGNRLDVYEETVKRMPYEDEGYRYNQDKEINDLTNPGIYGISASGYWSTKALTSDPLATASVVHNLDGRKVGHHKMGSDRYNHLFYAGR